MTALPVVLALAFLAQPAHSAGARDGLAGLGAEDAFGRALGRHGLVLVDWEGYIANPAVKLVIVPPPDARYPARVVVRAAEPRLSFDRPSRAGADGPNKGFRLDRPGKLTLHVSIFPDRDARDEDHALRVEFSGADGQRCSLTLPVHVLDQDRDRPASFPIAVDFSQDRTGFFADEARRAVVIRAAEDWAYFLDGDGLDPVPAGAEATPIWDPDGFRSSRLVTNEAAYTGYRLYAYGIDGPLLRSGGEPSRLGGFQSAGGAVLPIRRSGGYEAEVKGNYNRKGWLVGLGDDQWWRATNLGDVANDLDSIAHHEIGHALIFNPANPRFEVAKRAGRLRDERVRAYLGADPAIDRADHLAGAIDPASRHGAFGNEYHGEGPLGRWLPTRLDLLCAEAIGYRLRETSAFVPLRLRTGSLPGGTASAPYEAALRAEGGIPPYHWEVVGGSLPDGVTLDPFTGGLRGTPSRPGAFDFTIRVRDGDERSSGVVRRFRIAVAPDGGPSPAYPSPSGSPNDGLR